MPIKPIKEVYTDVGGNVTVEYSDDSVMKFNQADTVTSVTNPLTGGITKLIVGNRDALLDLGPNLNDESSTRSKVRKAIYAAIESGGYLGCLGDSTIAPWVNFPFGYGFSGALHKAIGEAGHVFSAHSQGVVAPIAGNNSTSSVWNLTGQYIFSLLASPLASATAATATPPQVGTAIRVFYMNTGGNSTVAIDGGTAAAMPRTGANTVAVYEKAGLTHGKHSAVFALTSGTDFHVFGVHVYNPGEPAVINFGAGGAKTSDVYQPGMWYSSYNTMKQLLPKVCFIRCGTNDIMNSIAQATIVANMMAIAAGLAASNIIPVFLPIVPISGKDAERAALWAAVKVASDAAGYGYADYGDSYFGTTFADANAAGIMNDTVHLNSAGQLREMAALRLWLNM